jgi:DNA-directed RNA polymerase specialized sigma24 family protein
MSLHDAQDLTQEFFARLLEKDWLEGVDRERGRFRSWLLAAMKHFLANEWKRGRRLKRGGAARSVRSMSTMRRRDSCTSQPPTRRRKCTSAAGR